MINLKSLFLVFCFFCLSQLNAQNNTFNPYSRYGIGELNSTTLSHNSGMGGAYIALKPDSTMPLFINTGNPAAYSLIKLTSLEVGGTYLYSKFKANTSSASNWGANFSYAAIGFPVKSNGGASFGIMPYSNVGYDTQNSGTQNVLKNDVTFKYNGTGSINKVFLGYGFMPFNKRLIRFKTNRQYSTDTTKKLNPFAFKFYQFNSKLLSDFSIGVNVNYLFGSIVNSTKVYYSNSSLFNNTSSTNTLVMNAFTGNFGAQTALTIDSVRTKNNNKRALNEKIKFTFGYFMALNNSLNGNFYSSSYNFIVSGSGQEITRDTVASTLKKRNIKLPLEQGFGVGFKKGERINIVSDFAITNWQQFKLGDDKNSFKNNYRMALGINFVPEKYATGSGTLFKRINYRLGASYQTGYISVNNTLVTDYYGSAGLGIPVGLGRMSSMINVSAQYGRMGTLKNNLVQQNYWRINFGFTFSDRWFQKVVFD